MDLSSGASVVTSSSGFLALIDSFISDSVEKIFDDERKSTYTGPVSDVLGHGTRNKSVTALTDNTALIRQAEQCNNLRKNTWNTKFEIRPIISKSVQAAV
jgi:hypothetical protein